MTDPNGAHPTNSHHTPSGDGVGDPDASGDSGDSTEPGEVGWHPASTWPHVSDIPLESLRQDKLWASSDQLVYSEIHRIAQRTVAPLLDGDDQVGEEEITSLHRSIVYAVHGGWGSGKSSFLQIVAEQAKRAAGKHADRLVAVHYDASVFQSVEVPASVTLAMLLVEKLAGGYDEARRLFPELMAGLYHGAEDRVDVVARRLGNEVAFPRWIDQQLGKKGESGRQDSRVALILIDELDRCEPDFIYGVLKTVRLWSQAKRLVFLLAVNEEPLRRSISEQPTVESRFGDSPYALQKYIQHAVTLPDLGSLTTQPLIDHLLYDGVASQAPVIAKAVDFWFRLALRADDYTAPRSTSPGDEYANPRAFKRCLNAVLPRIERRIKDRPKDGNEDDFVGLAVKEHVLAYRWRDVYEGLVYPGVFGGDRVKMSVFLRLQDACERCTRPGREDWELLEFESSRLRRDVSMDQIEFSRTLLLYLGLPPFWKPGDPRREDVAGPTAGRGPGGAEGSYGDRPVGFWTHVPDSALESLSTMHPGSRGSFAGARRDVSDGDSIMLRGDGLIDGGSTAPAASGDNSNATPTSVPLTLLQNANRPTDTSQTREIRSQFEEAYVANQAAEAARDAEAAEEAGRRVLLIVTENPAVFNESDCAWVGNAALTADFFDHIELAFQLFETAYRLSPSHANNIQNYIQFIVVNEVEPLYGRAEQLMAQLGEGRAAHHRPDRTLTLQARLASKLGRTVTEQQLDHLVADAIAHPTNTSKYSAAESVLSDVGDYGRLRYLVSELLKGDLEPVRKRTLRHRLANELGESSLAADRCDAMNMYRDLLGEPQTEVQLAEIAFNYAVMLNIYDYYEEAAVQFLAAYRVLHSREIVRRGVATYLLQGSPEWAGRALRGETLNVEAQNIVRPGGKPLPGGSFCSDIEM